MIKLLACIGVWAIGFVLYSYSPLDTVGNLFILTIFGILGVGLAFCNLPRLIAPIQTNQEDTQPTVNSSSTPSVDNSINPSLQKTARNQRKGEQKKARKQAAKAAADKTESADWVVFHYMSDNYESTEHSGHYVGMVDDHRFAIRQTQFSKQEKFRRDQVVQWKQGEHLLPEQAYEPTEIPDNALTGNLFAQNPSAAVTAPDDDYLVAFTYEDSEGYVSERTGRFIKKDGPRFMIYDDDREAQRTFRKDRVLCWHYGERNLHRRT